MRKFILAAAFLAASTAVFAVPNKITYQGTLKESGVPVTGSRTMQFRLTNAEGTAVYWSGSSVQVMVNQGLFSAVLETPGVNWHGIQPYIEVSVQGQLLLPREPVTSSAYALMCGSVDEGSVLSGMIAMFAGTCPSGWTRFGALDNRFPMGGTTYGTTGGSATHNHGGTTGGPNMTQISDAGNNFASPIQNHTHSIAADSNLPPYVTVVFCQKQ